jgi:hypothetical protein
MNNTTNSMTIAHLIPDAATIAQLLQKYPKLDAGGNHETRQDTIAKLYARDDRDLGQEIATARLWMQSVAPKPGSAYTLKHRLEDWVEQQFLDDESSMARWVSAAAVVLAADLAGLPIAVKDGRYFCG